LVSATNTGTTATIAALITILSKPLTNVLLLMLFSLLAEHALIEQPEGNSKKNALPVRIVDQKDVIVLCSYDHSLWRMPTPLSASPLVWRYL
jgi:hypothetical protein